MRFHTNLPVRDIKKTTDFYSALFGSAPVKTKADYVKFLPDSGGLNISFQQSAVRTATLTDLHLGFEMPDQESLDEAYARLERAGLVSSNRETSICCYANQDKFRVKDPDGYEWELYRLLEDTEQKIEKTSGCCGGAAACGSESRATAKGAGASGGACC